MKVAYHPDSLSADLARTAAQLALAGALPELEFACGLGALSLLRADVVPDGDSLRPVDGYLRVPRTPPASDPALRDAYELTDRHGWRDRLRRVRAELTRIRTESPLAN